MIRPSHSTRTAASLSVLTESPAVRVMHLVHKLDPGGMEAGVVKLVNGVNQGLVHSSICSTKPGGALKSLVRPSISVFDLKRRDGNDPWLIRDLYVLFQRERPDIVHTHAWGTLIEGLVAARLARVPVIIHGEHGTLQLRRHQRWLQRGAWTLVDQVLSVSSRLAQRIARETNFPLDRIRVIRNGVDLQRFGAGDRVSSRQLLSLPIDGLLAVTVGRLVPVKNHLGLVEALALLRSQGVAISVAIAGDGPLKSAIMEKATALGVATAVHLLGHTAEVQMVFAAADAFVLPSHSEGLSNTILEAMASGLPVVATRVGGADEMVVDGHTGLLVPPDSPRAIAGALASIAQDRPRASAMGLAGRRRAEAEFSLEAMLRNYETLYLEAARSKACLPTTPITQQARRERAGAA